MEFKEKLIELKKWKELSKKRHLNSNEKEQYYKLCYEICEFLQWQPEKLTSIEKCTNIKIVKIKEYARTYAFEILKISQTEFENKMYKYIYDKKNEDKNNKYKCDCYNNLLEQLIKTDTGEEIIKLIDQAIKEKNIHTTYLKERIADFVIEKHPEQKNTLIVSLERKIEIYKQHKKNKKPLSNQKRKTELSKEFTALSIKYINEFIENKQISVEDFCSKKGITLEYFEQILSRCKNQDIDLYKNYLDELVVRSNKLHFNSTEIMKQVVFLIKNGIEEKDGIKRNFEVVDFHLMTGLTSKDFSRLLESIILEDLLNIDEIRCIKNFFTINKIKFKENLSIIREIEKEKLVRIFTIRGTNTNNYTYIPIKEEILLIIEFLKENKIPLNEYNYVTAMSRYLNDELSVNNNLLKPNHKNNERRLATN